MSSPKSFRALAQLGQDLRHARLRRGMSVADLAVRAGSSSSTIARMEKGDRGVGIGTLADILVVLGLIERLGDLLDIREDELGMGLDAKRVPRRGRSSISAGKMRSGKGAADFDEDGLAF